MIKVTLNPEIQNKFERHYPQVKNPSRIFTKYIKQLEYEIMESLRFSNYANETNTYKINLERLKNKAGKYKIKDSAGKEKTPYVTYWITKYYPIYEKDKRGELGKQYSTVTFNSNVEIVNTSTQPTQALLQSTLDELNMINTDDEAKAIAIFPIAEYKNLLLDTSTKELFARLYPEFKEGQDYSKFLEYGDNAENFDVMRVDIRSLEAGINWLKNSPKCRWTNEKRNSALTQLNIIRQIAELTKYNSQYAHFYQRKSASTFGRTYYSGVSVQSIPSLTRRMVIGDSYHYDFKSCAIAYKMCYAKLYLAHIGKPEAKIHEEIYATHHYLKHKQDFLGHIKRDVFINSIWTDEYKNSVIKQAFLAIGFGARSNLNTCYYDDSGEKRYGAVNELFKDYDTRKRFNEHPLVVKFKNEQVIFEKVISEYLLAQTPGLDKLDAVRKKNGNPNPSKVVAWGYQHYEGDLMNNFLKYANEFAKTYAPSNEYHKPLGKIHDGTILNHPISDYYLAKITTILKDLYKNDYIALSSEVLKKYDYLIPETTIQFEIAHKTAMREELERLEVWRKANPPQPVKAPTEPKQIDLRLQPDIEFDTLENGTEIRPMPATIANMLLDRVAPKPEEETVKPNIHDIRARLGIQPTVTTEDDEAEKERKLALLRAKNKILMRSGSGA